MCKSRSSMEALAISAWAFSILGQGCSLGIHSCCVVICSVLISKIIPHSLLVLYCFSWRSNELNIPRSKANVRNYKRLPHSHSVLVPEEQQYVKLQWREERKGLWEIFLSGSQGYNSNSNTCWVVKIRFLVMDVIWQLSFVLQESGTEPSNKSHRLR